jgi:hypothetical protein
MTSIARRSIRGRIDAATELAAADDVYGGTTTLDVSGAQRVVIVQINNGTAGTLGIDLVEVSHDGGSNWAADDTLLALASDENTGTVVADGALNAAGVEPSGAAIFKSGPHNGPTLMRVSRATNWATGAPQVIAFKVL